ncbi:winged helix DNA-binding domain-containing protein [Haliscomenobacter sp.]|uniref:winged helix DNA-binding domain-containing protein n=1 Tax=Haliscomenobacter sp. TaxID=2717303 RepID=UPI0033650E93
MPTEKLPVLRLHNQKITNPDFVTPQELVAHMGAIQAQDYPMSKWAVGLRVPGTTDADIEAALDSGELVRTHVLRTTWHLVAGQDLRWMLALTSKQIKAASASRDRELGIDSALYSHTNDLIAKALEGGKNLTREEVMLELERGGVKTDSSRAVHFMMNAEVDAIVCNGVMKGKKLTYALIDEKIPPGLVLSKDEALATLAKRYFSSHAPATLPDFQWWSGLSMPDARAGLESIKNELQSFVVDGKTYFFEEKNLAALNPDPSVFFLPAFDEYTVSYKDRSTVFESKWHKEAITSNGIFKPIIVVDGLVVGTWKRTVQKNKVVIEPTFFDPKDKLAIEVMEKATAAFGTFLGLGVEIRS